MTTNTPPIARLAAEYGMSGRELGRHLGLPASTALRVLRGERALTIDEAVKAAKALGCEVTDLAAETASAA